MIDKHKGNPLGAACWKLSPDDIAEIRLRHEAGEKQCDLAREYGVSYVTIQYHIRSEKHRSLPYARALIAACVARKYGRYVEAAQHLRTAAELCERRKAA
jgi:sugar phosphate isomerase/epimerase